MAKSKTFGVVLIAGLIGAAVGLLFAPRSGKETREDLRKRTNDLKDQAAGTAGRVKRAMSDNAEEIRATVERSAEEMNELGKEAKRRAGTVVVDAKETASKVGKNTKRAVKDEDPTTLPPNAS